MKHIFILILTLGMFATAQAQDPAKDIKKAARSLGSYNLDPVAMEDKLDEAIQLADASINDPVVAADPTSWLTYGEVFLAAVDKDSRNTVLDTAAVVEYPFAPAKAYKGFMMTAQIADKSYQTKDAMKALAVGIQNIYYMGSVLYQDQNFAAAYEAFKATYDSYTLLRKHNEPTEFDPAEHPKALYYAGLCAQEAGLTKEATAVFEQLVKEGIAEPAVYEALVAIYSESNPQLSEKYLSEGRQKYLDDTALLYAEINHYLAKGELVSLIDKLEKALTLEPNNTSVIVTLGQIYDKLYQDNVTTDPAAAEGHFNKAMEYYRQAKEKDPNNFDATYSIGALYYNRAAAYSVELNTLANDYTPAGNKKYADKEAQMNAAFQQALPFFRLAENLNPNDLNTLTALKEIYARQDKLDLVNKYKAKIENEALRGLTEEEKADLPKSDGSKGGGLHSTGTGFFIDPSGYVTTNHHVINNANRIQVVVSKNGELTSYNAKVIKTDPKSDLAVIKIDDPTFKPFNSLPYNLKTDLCEVGTSVNVLGYPMVLSGMGAEIKYTEGRISSRSGYSDDVSAYQVSAAVQPGNSGGPLFDDGGNIVGVINAKIKGADNVTYAVKSSYLKSLIETMPNGLNTPKDTSLSAKSLQEKIKILSDYVVIVVVQ